MAIYGIPTTRISDMFFRERLLGQVQSDQRDLLRLQTQLSTGRKFELPSEEPVASLRVIGLQSLLERKAQTKTNLTTNQSYLTATDSAMASISDLINEAKGTALGVVDTIATDQQRTAAAQIVEQAIQQLIDTGNSKFRGRYLFAGSTTQVRPFETQGDNGIQYLGNEEKLLSYADLGLLFETNMHGGEVFGAMSEAVRGSVDLDPVLTYDTRLADLRGGSGISEGSVAISDGSHTSIVDLSGAETIGDVAAMLTAHPPQGRTIDVHVTTSGLEIRLDAAPGNLTIKEVGEGTTAKELGIFTPVGVGNDAVIGDDLDPALRQTTRLADIVGTRASASVSSIGPDNDIILEGSVRGQQLNGVTIRFVDDPTVAVGNELVDYDAAAGTITVHIDEGHTQASHVVEALNDPARAPGLPFTARLDPLDQQHGGQGLVAETPSGEIAGTTAGGSGEEFDQASGLQIVNAGETFTISLAGAETIEDLLNILNSSGAGVVAEINASRTGIDIRSRVSGADFAIGENGGTTASQLGVRSFTAQTPLEDLNYGQGVTDSEGTDFVITRADGVELEIDVSGLHTIGEVLQAINEHPANTPSAPGGSPSLVARLAAYGNGIELVDSSVGPGSLTVSRPFSSSAAVELGLIAEGQDVAVAAGSPGVLTGADVGKLEAKGVFTALLRLKSGLEDNDLKTIQRAIDMLDATSQDVNYARAELGARQQRLDGISTRLEDEDVQLREVLSQEYDADLAEVISNLTARQLALEASLQSTAQISKLTLLNYL